MALLCFSSFLQGLEYFVELEPLALYTEINGNGHGVQGLTCTSYEMKYP